MPMKNPSQIWFNGKFVPWEHAQVHVFSHAIHYGSSVFEGIRAYKPPRAQRSGACRSTWSGCYLRPHVSHGDAVYQGRADQSHGGNRARQQLPSCYIRPIAFRGYDAIGVDPRSCPVDVAIGVIEWGRYLGPEAIEQGVNVCVSSWRRMAPDTFPPWPRSAATTSTPSSW